MSKRIPETASAVDLDRLRTAMQGAINTIGIPEQRKFRQSPARRERADFHQARALSERRSAVKSASQPHGVSTLANGAGCVILFFPNQRSTNSSRDSGRSNCRRSKPCWPRYICKSSGGATSSEVKVTAVGDDLDGLQSPRIVLQGRITEGGLWDLPRQDGILMPRGSEYDRGQTLS